MKQLNLPLTLARMENLKLKAQNILQYVREHPSDLIMALLLVLVMDIEDELEELGE